MTAAVMLPEIIQCVIAKRRSHGGAPFNIGAEGAPRILICTDGRGQIEHDGVTHAVRKGEVWLMPALVGACTFDPDGEVNLFEVAIPEDSASNRSELVREPNLLCNVAKVQGWMADEKADCF